MNRETASVVSRLSTYLEGSVTPTVYQFLRILDYHLNNIYADLLGDRGFRSQLNIQSKDYCTYKLLTLPKTASAGVIPL
jgi:hypothetical protein